jgi:hypothetical protein
LLNCLIRGVAPQRLQQRVNNHSPILHRHSPRLFQERSTHHMTWSGIRRPSGIGTAPTHPKITCGDTVLCRRASINPWG